METDGESVDDSILERFEHLSTGEVADTKLDDVSVLSPEIVALHTDCSVVGTARTAKLDPTALCPPVRTLETARAGEIVVIDTDGRVDEAVWGDLLSTYAKATGVNGVVTNGAIRDKSGVRELGFPAFTQKLTPRGPTGSEEAHRNVPVTVGGALIESGDVIVADETGVVVVRGDAADEVAAAAEDVAEMERGIREHIEGGGSLEEAL